MVFLCMSLVYCLLVKHVLITSLHACSTLGSLADVAITNRAYKGDYKRSEECPPEGVDCEAGNEGGGEPEKERVDDEYKDTEGQNTDRQGKDDE